MLLAPFGALVAGVLPGLEVLDYLVALAGGEHGLEGVLHAPFGQGQGQNLFGLLLFQGALILAGLGQVGGGAGGGEEAVHFLLVEANLVLHGFEPVEHLLAGEEGMNVNFHGLLLLAVAQGLHGLEGESKCFHLVLGSAG